MRILHTIAARDWGGIAYRTVEQVLWLNAHGHTSWLACPAGSEVAIRATKAGAPVLEFDFSRPFSPATIWKLRSLINRLRCDVAEAHTGRCANAAMMVSDRCAVVRTRHTTQPLKPSLSRRLRWRWGWDWTVATAQVIADSLTASQLVPANRISVIGEWVGSRFFDYAARPLWRDQWRRRLGIDGNAFAVGAIGMLRPEKGFDVLIRAIKLLKAAHPEFVAVIVGEGAGADSTYERELRTLVVSLGLDENVLFAGYHQDVPGLLQAFDAVAVPSTFEAQSRVVPEAMASQRPIVASRVGGIAELIHDGQTGWLVWPGDPTALAHHLLRIRNDPSGVADVCRSLDGFAREHLHIDRKMDEYMAVYDRARHRRHHAA